MQSVRTFAITAGALLLVSTPALADPAMWLVSDPDSKVYLLGSVHTLKPDTVWRTPAIEAAIAESTALWVETTDVDKPAELQTLVQSLGFDPSTRLSSYLTEEERTRLAEVATEAGLPAAALEPMRPWLAALTLVVLDILKSGYDPEAGVDRVLMTEARAAGKTVHGLETAQQGLEALAGMSPELGLDMLRSTLDKLEFPFDRMIADWAAGDLAAIEREEIGIMETYYPDLYRVLIVDRNRAWTDQLLEHLDGAGTTLVVVGTGHLVGDDSVLAMLEAEGVAIDRLQ